MDLTSRVEKLYLPAVGAYMAGLEGYVGKGTRVTKWREGTSPGEEGPAPRSAHGFLLRSPDYLFVISLTASDGTGGGRILLVIHEDTSQEITNFSGDRNVYVNQFESIRHSLKMRFLNFNDLPVDSNFQLQVDNVKSAIGQVAFDFYDTTWGELKDSTNATVYVPSKLAEDLDLIYNSLNNVMAFSGNAVIQLQKRYGKALQTSTRAIWGLLFIYGGHIAAEQELWRLANHSVDSILDQAYKAFTSAANKSAATIQWVELLEFIGVASRGLALMGVPAAAVLGEASNFAATVIKKAGPGERPEQTVDSFDEVMEFTETALGEIRSAVWKEEADIVSNIEANMASIRKHADSYDLTANLFDDLNRGKEDAAGVITWATGAAATLSTCMRRAANYYSEAGRLLGLTSISDASTRPSGLGKSTTGPAKSVGDFGAMLRALLLALDEELAVGATNVNAVTNLIMDTEADLSSQMTVLESQIDLTPFSQIESATVSVNPLAVDAPAIPSLHIKSMMETQTEQDHIPGYGRI